MSAVKPETAGRSPQAIFSAISANINRVIRGQSDAIRRLVAAFAAGGHVLLEDVPGTGKTTLAKALAVSIDADFQRIQFTPDLLPADILGVSIFHQKTRDFEFHPGPVFTNILLADEINRASPRTQSALLEAMAEGQVSLDRVRRPLDEHFFVVATQNPIEFQGTYPLPESQMDRFAMRFSLGYVLPEEEVSILSDQATTHPLDGIGPCVDLADVRLLKKSVRRVRISEEMKRYIVDLIGATRRAEGIRIGASPRASLAFMKCAQALALFDGRDFVTPEDVQEIAVSVIAHRVVMEPQARFSGLSAERVVEDALRVVAVPA
jgi:MoxR-like ATPase